jgi:hypothetical protein
MNETIYLTVAFSLLIGGTVLLALALFNKPKPKRTYTGNEAHAFHTTGYQLGQHIERQRIIKLIDSLRCQGNGIEHDCEDDLGGYSVDELISLIKGEAK